MGIGIAILSGLAGVVLVHLERLGIVQRGRAIWF
jgi:hypothetical protein